MVSRKKNYNTIWARYKPFWRKKETFKETLKCGKVTSSVQFFETLLFTLHIFLLYPSDNSLMFIVWMLITSKLCTLSVSVGCTLNGLVIGAVIGRRNLRNARSVCCCISESGLYMIYQSQVYIWGLDVSFGMNEWPNDQ